MRAGAARRGRGGARRGEAAEVGCGAGVGGWGSDPGSASRRFSGRPGSPRVRGSPSPCHYRAAPRSATRHLGPRSLPGAGTSPPGTSLRP